MSNDTLQQMSASLTRIDRRIDELIADNARLRAALVHCDRLAGCQGNAQDVSLAMGEIRSLARSALSPST